jgi:hypothetical protein
MNCSQSHTVKNLGLGTGKNASQSSHAGWGRESASPHKGKGEQRKNEVELTSHHRFTPSNFRVSCTPTPLMTSLFFRLCAFEPMEPKWEEKLIEERADSRL